MLRVLCHGDNFLDYGVIGAGKKVLGNYAETELNLAATKMFNFCRQDCWKSTGNLVLPFGSARLALAWC